MKTTKLRVPSVLLAAVLSCALTGAAAVPTSGAALANGMRRPMGGGFHGGGFHGGGFRGGRGFRGGFGGFDGGFGGLGAAGIALGVLGVGAAIAASQVEAAPVCGYARQAVLRPNGTYYYRTVQTCD